MGKIIKKLIAVIFITMTANFCLVAQSNTSSDVLTEDSILLTDSTTVTANSQDFKTPSTAKTFVRMIVVLIIVVALIYGVLWFIRKKSNVVKSEDDYLRRVAYINIAPGKTVEVITLIDKAYLIGVTEDNITLLGEIEDKELIQAMNLNSDKKANTKKPATFAEVLDLFLVKNKNKNIFSASEKKIDEIFTNNQPKE